MTARRQAIILALLAIEANAIVPVSRLVEAVWSTDPPPTARGQVQICVSALRRLLVDMGIDARIQARNSGYVLHVATDLVDVHEFERLTTEGRAAESARRLAEAAEKYQGALDLWRGDLLPGIDSLVVSKVALRLAERRLNLMEDAYGVSLSLGRHNEALDELKNYVDAYPFRERLQHHLMVALYRSGRQVEALDVYRGVRQVLVEELGIEPGENLRRLERAILVGDRGIVSLATSE